MNIKKIYLKYKDDLINYKYCSVTDIDSIPLKSNIKYISKNNFIKKNGFLKEIKNSNIMHLYNSNRNWFIYVDKYYIFYKLHNKNKLKECLQNIINSDFKIKKLSCHKTEMN